MKEIGKMGKIHTINSVSAASRAGKLALVEKPPVVKIERLTKRFGMVTALADINLEVSAGRVVGLLGPNCSGKTSLIKILASFYTSYEGRVLIDGQKPSYFTKTIVSYF